MSDDADDRVLDPEDLDVTDSEHVRTLDDDRFVVSTDAGRAREPPANEADPDRVPEPGPSGPGDDRASTPRDRTASLPADEFDYGFDAVLALNGETTRRRMGSNDVAETFEALACWFARSVGGELPPAEVLGVLLAGMDAPIRLPEREIRRALDRHGLSPDDSVADLLAAVREEGGLALE